MNTLLKRDLDKQRTSKRSRKITADVEQMMDAVRVLNQYGIDMQMFYSTDSQPVIWVTCNQALKHMIRGFNINIAEREQQTQTIASETCYIEIHGCRVMWRDLQIGQPKRTVDGRAA